MARSAGQPAGGGGRGRADRVVPGAPSARAGARRRARARGHRRGHRPSSPRGRGLSHHVPAPARDVSRRLDRRGDDGVSGALRHLPRCHWRRRGHVDATTARRSSVAARLAPSRGRDLLAGHSRHPRTRHAGLRESPSRSPALGRDQFHQGARRGRRLEERRTPGGARPRLARPARLHRGRRPPGTGRAARLPRTADGAAGALHAAGVPLAHDGAGAEL